MFEQAFKNIDDILRKDAGCASELDYTEQTSWLLFLKYLDALKNDKVTESVLGGGKYAHRSPKAIMDEISALDAESAEVLGNIRRLSPGNANQKPGNANLPIGDLNEERASQETGVSGVEKTADQEIGVPGVEKTANREIGVSGLNEWRSRGYLPHYDNAAATQHVTFHLADSLPVEVLQRLEIELKTVPEEKQDAERRKRLDAWIDAGHGSCILQEPAIANMVENSILFFDAQRYRLLAWVVMPNHVHVLFQPMNGRTVAETVASWKKFTARRICDYRKWNLGNANLQPGNANLLIGDWNEDKVGKNTAIQENGVPGLEKTASQETCVSRVWHREYWDRYIRDNHHFQQAVDYIHQNPVKAGLIAKVEDWSWSSARFNNEKRVANRNPGNANLPIGVLNKERADQEIGVPRGQP
jgi:REP element-mobilizing transposase RayT